jgi:serine/threonine protein kinase
MASSFTTRSGRIAASPEGVVRSPHMRAGSHVVDVPAVAQEKPAGNFEAKSPATERKPTRPVWNATGPWQHVETLHEGPVSVVFCVRPQTGGEAAYVLKRLQPHWQDDLRAVALLEREAAVGRAVRHRNLVPVLDAQLRREPRYVVMPLLQGQTLETLLAARSRLALADALWIARQVAEALGALDAAGWMHGDVKPANIMVSPQGHVTLIDLGFARRPGEDLGAVDRPVPGTPWYMAPEMFLSRLRPDIRSDLYSLGAVMYRMLTGQSPFEGNSVASVLEQQLRSRPRPLGELNAQVPDEVAALVHRLLAKDSLRRPSSPVELVRQLVALELVYFESR